MTHFSAKLPIWYQLAQALRTEIRGGALPPGTRIDAEVRLAQRYGISVIPVRQALRALEEEGLIVRRRGSGTYVGDAVRASAATTSLETLYSREFARPAKIVERGETAVPARFAAHFPGDDRLAFVRRLAYRDGATWSYGTLYFPILYAAALTDARLERYPLYRLLGEHHGIKLARSQFEAKAVAADGVSAGFLGIDPYSPALALSCVSFDGEGSAVGAFEMLFPGDPFVFAFETPHDPD